MGRGNRVRSDSQGACIPHARAAAHACRRVLVGHTVCARQPALSVLAKLRAAANQVSFQNNLSADSGNASMPAEGLPLTP